MTTKLSVEKFPDATMVDNWYDGKNRVCVVHEGEGYTVVNLNTQDRVIRFSDVNYAVAYANGMMAGAML